MASSSSPRLNCPHISLDEIEDATDNFDKRYSLGHGGEGDVYLAEIRLNSKKTQVAVKRLKPEHHEVLEKEIKTVSTIQHPNLVSLLGYCDESGKKILMYEFMEKGSLSSYVKKKSSISLSWQQRLRICLGAARGLQHLHAKTDEFPKGIIHRDVKPDNILLDKNWVAKISDFGMFKLSHVGQVQSTMITTRKGTSGYYAPEYVSYRSVTRKIDVYALGVVLFQVLCLKLPWDRGDQSYYYREAEDLGIWAQQNVDTRIKEEICDDSLKAFTAIVGNSLKRDPRKRPTMHGVVLDLENALKLQMREDEAEQLQGARESAAKESDGQSTGFSPKSPRMSRQKWCDQISLDEIKDTTDYFDERNVLGHRGGGKVYRAEIRLDGKMTQVAVKHSNSNSHEEFEKEIKTVSMMQHPNLVSLLGNCDESGERILLYEHMEKGSLSSYVMEKSSISLSWQQRLRICLGAARGLQHLHSETDEFPKGIIHRHVKPDNILLDKNWVAKIWGFEMFMLSHIGQIQSTMSTNVGYYAPEYITSITRKMDVYAFGVVLLQVLCLKMPWDWENDYDSMENENLGIWAQQNVDTRIKEVICDDSLYLYTVIVEKCLKTDPRKRPTMDVVVLDLENVLKYQELDDEEEQLQSAIVSDQQSTGFLPNASRLPRQKYCDHISLVEIKDATNSFDPRRVLGSGGTGTVYLAEIRLGGKRTQVAVKHIESLYYEGFAREIMTTSKIQHPNFVSVVGYCDESGQQIVLSEFMEKGSLSSYVKKKSSISLSWQQRLGICLGAARGLQHLHTETDEFPKGIIHRNVKPGNILLDKNWVAKITGFEMVKLSHVGQIESAMTTNLKGTSGYYAPEYFMYFSITRKIDVFAFGVVLFQVLCMKLPWECQEDDEEDGEYNIRMNDGDFGILAQQNVDTRIKEEICDDSLKAFTAIVEKSLKKDPLKRPTMDEVVLDLENALKCQELEDEAKQLRGGRESDEQMSQGSQDKRDYGHETQLCFDIGGGITN